MKDAVRARFNTLRDSEPQELVERLYHLPVLGLLMAFMLWVRLQSYDNFVRDGEFFFVGNDPWYHFRETTYVVHNYPSTMPYDIWTQYPIGRLAGQFGTLWDQLVATAILIIGLGDPTEAQAGMVMLVATAVMATLVAIPTYYIARRFVSRPVAIFSVLLLALAPGQFLTRSTVGSFQHHAAETFFMSVAVLAMLAALTVAERHTPVWELVVDRDIDGLRPTLEYSVLAGIATALYLYVWQAGVLLIGIFGAFFVIKITADVIHEETPEPTIFVGSVSMAVTGLLMVIPFEEFGIDTTGYSLLQIFFPLAIAGGCLFLGVLDRQRETRGYEPSTYPAAVGGIAVVGSVIMAVGLPSLWDTLFGNFVRFVGFGATDTARTIAEAQSLLAQGGIAAVLQEFGMLFFVAAAGLVGLLSWPLVQSDETNHTMYAAGGITIVGLFLALPAIPEVLFGLLGIQWQVGALAVGALLFVGATYLVEYSVEELLLITWALFLTAATFTQIRFSYYLIVPVVILNGIVVAKVIAWTDLSVDSLGEARETVTNIEGWQAMVIATVLLLILIPGLVVPIEAAGTQTAWQIGEDRQPGGVVGWDDSLQWMSDETPQPGDLEGADNADQLEYYGTYEHPGDDGFEYPEGAYGVMSWWDYGHWITVRGERMPHANPFQDGSSEAADYLLAPNESDAAAELADLNSQNEAPAQTRYVMIDWQMVSPDSKFAAPTVFTDKVDVEDTQEVLYFQGEGDRLQPVMRTHTQRYYESQMVRLYQGYGSAIDPEPVVVNWDPAPGQAGQEIRLIPSEGGLIETFATMEEAEAFVEETGTAQIGGVAGIPSERVEALEQYRLVRAGEQRGQSPDVRQLQTLQQLGELEEGLIGPDAGSDDFVKTFERVPGATIQGSGATPGEEVQATVAMEKNTGEQFTYTQYAEADANGNFEMTVPYSTTGYDEFGPEDGYTNPDVRATGSYTFISEDGQPLGEADVTEAQVIGEDETPVTISL